MQLQKWNSTWCNTEENPFFNFENNYIKNNIQESITARKVMDDLSDWGQQKKNLDVII
jgi:hypothetical protein